MSAWERFQRERLMRMATEHIDFVDEPPNLNDPKEVSRLIETLYNVAGSKAHITVSINNDGFAIEINGKSHQFNTDVDSARSGLWFLES